MGFLMLKKSGGDLVSSAVLLPDHYYAKETQVEKREPRSAQISRAITNRRTPPAHIKPIGICDTIMAMISMLPIYGH